MTALLNDFERLLTSGEWQKDPVQADAIARLGNLGQALTKWGGGRQSLVARLSRRPSTPPQGLYLWGGVGRGKSALMDLFFKHAPEIPKLRVHFHAFMLDVHARVYEQRRDPSNKGDPLKEVAKQISAEVKLLCFDEFQVTDTADAMILSRLFKKMFERDIVVVATSNRPPDDLYLDGLNRELFLPFIGMLKERCAVFELDGGKDYRLEQLRDIGVFHTPLGEKSEAELSEAFKRLTGSEHGEPMELHVQGRTVVVPQAAAGVGHASFTELCGRPLGSADYLAIADTLNTLLISGIPVMGPEKRNEAKRFTTLIDALYEHRVNLICSAEAEPDRLYVEGHGAFEFERTVSRLIEMQSPDYMAQEHVVGETAAN